MFKLGKKKTTRTVTSTIAKLVDKEWVLVGANYDTNLLSTAIPIATRVEDFLVIPKDDIVKGTIYFRPVGDETINTLKVFRGMAEYWGFGDFLDEDTDVPMVETSFETNLIGADSIMSNIQEIPFRPSLVKPDVYKQEVTIKGTKLTQVTIKDVLEVTAPVDSDLGVLKVIQVLTLLFMPKHYDAQTLLGYWADKELNKADGLKILKFLANGSLSPLIVGAVNVINDCYSATMYPLYNDIGIAFRELDNNKTGLYIQCDTGVVFLFTEDIDRILLHNTGEYKYNIELVTKKGNITLMLG